MSIIPNSEVYGSTFRSYIFVFYFSFKKLKKQKKISNLLKQLFWKTSNKPENKQMFETVLNNEGLNLIFANKLKIRNKLATKS